LLEIAVSNLTSIPVLAFALGLVATKIGSDLRLPEAIFQGFTIYLLLGIGIKGGVALNKTEFSELLNPILWALILSFLIPTIAFFALPLFGKFSIADRGVLLESLQIYFEGFVVSLLAILEIPGILVGLLLARQFSGSKPPLRESLREILTGKSIILLSGGLVLGALTGQQGYAKVEPFFSSIFTGVLALFLLEMGIVAGRRLSDLRESGVGLFMFAVTFPLLSGFLGVSAGHFAGLSMGGATTLGVLSASASYIAAPAAVRLALPEASPGKFLTASLGITFPFNLTFGIPAMLTLSQWMDGFFG
jgi:hypothetical protein